MGHRLGVLFDPRFWNRVHPIDHAWSDALEMMLDSVEGGEAELVRVNKFYVRIGAVPIWISNFPYSYGKRFDSDQLPRRKTVLRLAHAVAMADFRAGHHRMGKESAQPHKHI